MPTHPQDKRSTSLRLTVEALDLLASLATAYGISQSATMEIAVRELAKRKQITKGAA